MILQTVADYLTKSDTMPDIKERMQSLNEMDRFYEEFFTNQRFIDVLINDYKEHGNIIVAFDFDDTIQPSKGGISCEPVVKLLQVCSALGFTMICYTARTLNSDINMVKDTCKKLNIKCDYVNEESDAIKAEREYEHDNKIFYNIFLDDRAGLVSAFEILLGFVNWFLKQKTSDIDSRKEGY
jgi:hypothetical protein